MTFLVVFCFSHQQIIFFRKIQISRDVEGFQITNNQAQDDEILIGQPGEEGYDCYSICVNDHLPHHCDYHHCNFHHFIYLGAAVYSTVLIQPNMCLNQDDPVKKECRFGRWFSMPCSWLRLPQPVN